MPWSRLRPIRRPSDQDPRRHSSIVTSQPQSQPLPHTDDVPLRELPPSPLRASFISLDYEGPSSAIERPSSPLPIQEPTPNHHRFSMLRFRHASDSQLLQTAKQQAASSVPPMPAAPTILTTAPTLATSNPSQKRKSAFALGRRYKNTEASRPLSSNLSRKSLSERTSNQGGANADSNTGSQSVRASRVTFDQAERLRGPNAPPAYGDETNSALALPISRLSESSKSDGSSGDHGLYATTTTTHTISTTTTFFRLPRRKKNKGPLFPLPVKTPPPYLSLDSAITPSTSTSGCLSDSPRLQSPSRTPPPLTALHRPFHAGHGDDGLPSPLPSPSHVALAASSMSFAVPGIPLSRRDSTASGLSTRSSTALGPPGRLGKRGRSSTIGSLSKVTTDGPLLTPPLPSSGRTSTSTTGRASLGNLLNLARLRQNSEPPFLRHGSSHTALPGTPGSPGSKSNSFNLVRESVVVPQRQVGDTPAKYLVRLEEAVSRGAVAIILSKSGDDFSKNVLRSYMRGFKFFGDPLDMSIRKLLMEVELPKETQQIDRVLQSFADRYHECNPGIYASPDEAYFIAFSILILHTDVFNKNNKHKMQKQDYIKNTKGQGVADEILECFYDNISYTPFIHVDDDVDISGEKIVAHKTRTAIFPGASADTSNRNSREPVDPYTLILDNKLDSLRPTLKDVMNLEEPYNYLGTASSLNMVDLHRTFFRSGVLQILSSRSRPEAFKSPATISNPAEAHPGVVDIKITKVGILWRKDMKKKKARSPWQEWGALLTGSQLYFFRNTTWIRNLMHQYDGHHKQGLAGAPVIFKPPLEQFKPDVLMSTENAVALFDSSYKKHKNAFVFVRHGGFEETFLAENESHMNDWLSKLNYAAAFRSAGVRMRGVVGGSYDGQRIRGTRRIDSSTSVQSFQTPTGEVTIQRGKLDAELALQILTARRQIMVQKIKEADEKLLVSGKQLDGQLRNARHLQILAPVQNKSREQIVLAAGRMAAQIKWVRLGMWCMRCHRDILALDLKEEIKSGNEQHLQSELIPDTLLTTTSSQRRKSEGLRRLRSTDENIISPQRSPRPDLGGRPKTQAFGQTPSGLDGTSQTSLGISPQASHHRAQGSWELPPLDFHQTPSSRASTSTVGGINPAQRFLTHQSSIGSVQGGVQLPSLIDIATKLVTPTQSADDDEHEILKEAGLIGPDSSNSTEAKRPETASDQEKDRDWDKSRSLEPDFHDGKAKIRRSLHRTLRDAHVPTHHRSRKGKDSGSSAAMTEDTSSLAESEGLARGTGSFTVHGKKASVITFGSEWQKMSPEERLKLRKSAQGDDSKLSTPCAIEDESASIASALVADARPASVKSSSTATEKSVISSEAYGTRKGSVDPTHDDFEGEAPQS